MQTEKILQDYERDGVVRVRGLLSPEEVEEVKTQLAHYISEHLSSLPTGDRTFENDGKTVRNLWRMERHDEYFARLAARPDILELVSKLVHGEPVLLGVETFNKPAKTGSGVPAHQDNAYFCQSPPDTLTVWIAIDAATIENGAIYYVKGSQHELLPHAPSGVAGNSMGLVNPPAPDPKNEFVGTLAPGDALIHHGQTIHRSEPNTTEYSRCGLLLVFRGAHTEYDPKLKENYERARDLIA
jgi:ectoine hydroxylase-related dioxygenase (phytanoyl-CoA dioxygenase family)